MPKSDRLYLLHMRDYAAKAAQLTTGKGREDFDRDEALRFALAYLLQVTGEAARHVSRATRDAHPEIPWRDIVGMRHRIVHDYTELNEDIVWRTATEALGPLLAQLDAILSTTPERA